MQSFSYQVKSELCRVPVQRVCCARAEAYGVLLYCNTFTPSEVRIITENEDFAERLPKLFHKAFSVRFDRLPEEEVLHKWEVIVLTVFPSGGGLLQGGLPAGGIPGRGQRHRSGKALSFGNCYQSQPGLPRGIHPDGGDVLCPENSTKRR